MNNTSIKIEGLKDFQRDLRAIDKDLPKELRKANLQAAEVIAEGAKASFASRGGVAPKVAPSVKALAQQRNASVKIGGKAYPFAGGAEFGGGKYGKGNPTARGGHTTQFEAFRQSGYSLWPTLKDKSDEVVEAYGKALDRLTKKAFPG